MKKSKKSKDNEPSKNTKQAGSSKGATQSQPKSTSKSVQTEETFHEVVDADQPMNQENDFYNVDDQYDVKAAPKKDKSTCFKQPPSLLLLILKGTKAKHTPIDFMAFAMKCLKLTELTKADLVGPVYKLLKGTCKSYIEMEYNMEECYRALSDQLDWNNPEGDRCPYDLTKPLPFYESLGRLTIPANFFFSNDLEYLRA
ncbi:hypothetical protein Tco_1479932 [Tanacetum coccineum]